MLESRSLGNVYLWRKRERAGLDERFPAKIRPEPDVQDACDEPAGGNGPPRPAIPPREAKVLDRPDGDRERTEYRLDGVDPRELAVQV